MSEVSERHPEDYCHRCDGPNISWYTPGAVWDPVMRPTGEAGKWSEIVCPLCFVELAGGGTWALIPMKDDGQPWTSADERARIAAEARVEERERAKFSDAVRREQIRVARAEAWEEGYEAGDDDTFSTRNPYRADAAEREAR